MTNNQKHVIRKLIGRFSENDYAEMGFTGHQIAAINDVFDWIVGGEEAEAARQYQERKAKE